MAKGTPAKGTGSGKTGASAASTRPGGKPSRSRKPPPVVVAKPKPWALIAATVAVIVFAVAIIGYAVVQVGNTEAMADPASIEGLQEYEYAPSQHVPGTVDYAETPPVGGEHDNAWADCTGTVYNTQIRSENAVHSLEHGAVWITYDPELPQDQVDTLAGIVSGEDYTMLSPFPDMQGPIALQTWGTQLFVDSADDPRIEQFITALKSNVERTPEFGASCENPAFAANPLGPGEE
ncbi:DUF3105 domain-containing protein [soil metagenome]